MKKLLIIADPLQRFNINGDSTYLLMLTAKDMGFQLSHCLAGEVYSLNDKAYASVVDVKISYGVNQIQSNQNWFNTSTSYLTQLAEFDAVFVRNDPPFDMEYYYLTQILGLAEKAGVKVINHSAALRNFNEKLAILNFPDLITPTLVSKSKQLILEFIAKNGTCVVKPIDMMAGRGVFLIAPDDPNQGAIIETLTDYFSQTIMVQRFIPDIVNGDKRIFIVNGEIINYCLYRIPPQGQIRGNLAVGGRGKVQPLSNDDYKLAQQVAAWLVEQRIVFAGIDVIGKCLTEINITSPTGAQQILHEAGINVMQKLLQATL